MNGATGEFATEQVKGSVLITGASSGIGKACALHFDRAGYRVFAGVRTPEAEKRLKSDSSKRLLPVILDVTDSEQIKRVSEKVEDVLDTHNGLTGLINNAGITLPGAVEFMPLGDLRRILEVNAIGQIAVIQRFLPLIRQACGRIINIGSVLGRFAMPLAGGYAASKFAVEALTDSLRRELRPWHIRVILIEPGSVESSIWDKISSQVEILESGLSEEARNRYEPIMSGMIRIWEKAHRGAAGPEVVARVVQHCLECKRPRARYLVGPDARLPSFLGKFLPDRLNDWLVDKAIRKKGTS